jgi:hypothetical protein
MAEISKSKKKGFDYENKAREKGPEALAQYYRVKEWRAARKVILAKVAAGEIEMPHPSEWKKTKARRDADRARREAKKAAG